MVTQFKEKVKGGVRVSKGVRGFLGGWKEEQIGSECTGLERRFRGQECILLWQETHVLLITHISVARNNLQLKLQGIPYPLVSAKTCICMA